MKTKNKIYVVRNLDEARMLVKYLGNELIWTGRDTTENFYGAFSGQLTALFTPLYVLCSDFGTYWYYSTFDAQPFLGLGFDLIEEVPKVFSINKGLKLKITRNVVGLEKVG
jgi:hypothetical protein